MRVLLVMLLAMCGCGGMAQSPPDPCDNACHQRHDACMLDAIEAAEIQECDRANQGCLYECSQ